MTMALMMMVMMVFIGFASAHVYPNHAHPATQQQQVVQDEWIKSICSQTDYPQVCETTIVPYQNGNNDPASVLEMQLKAAIDETKIAAHKAATPQPHLATTSNGCEIKCYQSCLKIYNTALESLHKALILIQSSHAHEIDTHLNPINTEVKACDECFTSAKSTTTPFHHYDDYIFKMNTNCLNLRLMANPEG